MKRYELSLTDYWLIIRKRKLVIILTFVFLSMLSFFYSLQMEPIYEAVATIRIADIKTEMGPIPRITMALRTGMDPVLTEAKAILGLSVLQEVCTELGWIDENSTRDEVLDVVNELRQQMDTEALEETNMIEIIVRDPDPMLAATIANSTARAYIKEDLNRRAKEARAVLKDVEGQLKEVQAQLKSKEDEILKLKKSGEAKGIAVVLQDRLMKLEDKRANILTRYTEKHPEVISLTEQIESVKKKMNTLPAGEIALARATRTVDALSDVYKDLIDKRSQARIAQAQIVEEVQIIEPAVAPLVPVSPNVPLDTGIGAGAGVILGFLLAFLVENLDTSIIAIETVEDLTGLTVLGIIPYIRKPKKEKKKKKRLQARKVSKKARDVQYQLVISRTIDSNVMEAFKSLRTNIQLKTEKEHKNLLLVSSSNPAEGKTVVAANLAIVMAQNKIRTLLVDSDLRRPFFHTLFGVERSPGLSDILLGSTGLEESKKTITDILTGDLGWTDILEFHDLDYLHLLTCGSHVDNTAELFSSPGVKDFIDEVRSKYDMVIFDSPPALVVTDAVLLGSQMDGILLVYKAGKTPKNALLRAIEQFNISEASLLGIVLNIIKPQIKYFPHHHYKYKYETPVGKGAAT